MEFSQGSRKSVSCIIQIGSKYDHIERVRGGYDTDTDTEKNTQTTGRGNVTTEAETGVIWPEAKERWKKHEEFPPLEHQKGVHHCPHLHSGFWPPEF